VWNLQPISAHIAGPNVALSSVDMSVFHTQEERMSFRTWIAAIALGALTVAPAASAQTSTAANNDSAIKSRVEARLNSVESLKAEHINVSVDNGVVTLKGDVRTAADRERAAELAKVAGVTTVENKLEVEGADKGIASKSKDATVKGAEKTKDATVKGAEKTKDATVKGAKKTGEATKDVAGTTGEAITDAWITTKIKADYVNEDTLKGSDINVDTNEHVVTLKGTVASAAGKARAEEIAKTTKGVTRVVNTLTIGPKK
jgi:hyperosmotically inducible protein